MSSAQNNEKYNIISFICFVIVVTPIILVLYWGTETTTTGHYHNMVRLETGKLFIKNKGATQEPKNETILVAEGLNRHVAEIAIQSPGNANKIQNSTPEMISRTLESLSTDSPTDLLKKATARSIKWSPEIGSHGLFILPHERTPTKTSSFGSILLPGGKEKSIFYTEKKTNKILHDLRKLERGKTSNKIVNIEALVSNALRTRPPLISPEEGVELIGLCYGLNIVYNEHINLFLSEETLPEIITWKKELLD